jgi:ribose-phosphate pyrophosphokinase
LLTPRACGATSLVGRCATPDVGHPIYDDMTRTAKTLIRAAEKYIDAGAVTVEVLVSHLALIGLTEIQTFMNSPIRKIVAINSHRHIRHEMIKENTDKFLILDMSNKVTEYLIKILPKA